MRGIFRAAAVGLCAAGLSVTAGTPAIADSGAKIAVVDIQRALTTSKAGQEAQKKYEAEVKKAQSDIDVKKGEFQKLQQSVDKQKDSLNPKALGDKQEQLIAMEKDLKRSFQDQQESLRRKNAELVGGLVKRLRKIVDDFGKEGGYTVVLERGSQSVLFADGSVDITDKVVSKFDGSE